jgi:adenosylhomocysteine nucleosidase
VEPDQDASASFGILAALPEELASLRAQATSRRTCLGLELWELQLGAARALACVAGVGKVNAAHGASVLISNGATRGLFVVGVCGGLRQRLVAGTLVHCERAVQTDLALRTEREVHPDVSLRTAWQAQVPGRGGWFLTADRPVLSLWRRLRLARAFAGDCVADMEAAAAGAVARRAGVPWAALRAVTDQATEGGLLAFRKNFQVQADRAAATLPGLLNSLWNGRNPSLPQSTAALVPEPGTQ